MSEFETVIGLEVHVQLKTRSKLFCDCPVDWGGEPNSRVCPVCLGLPGTLPVLNRKSVELGVRAALALNCRIAPFSQFHRKNYFYPDMAKNYQVSQYDLPLSADGFVEIPREEGSLRVGLARAHLEEDTGKLVHFAAEGFSGVDFNRSGVPLLEIVTRPDLRSPEDAYDYLKVLRNLLRTVEVSDCDMEKGSFRCDANVSLRLSGSEKLGVKTEVKNMNSFRAVERALSYEVSRQAELIRSGGAVVQETRLYDAASQKTFPMRSKEEAHDYRYFPDPDLVPTELDRVWIEEISAALPELPSAKAGRFQRDYELGFYDAGVLTSDPALAEYFETAARACANFKTLSNWITVELMARLKESDTPIESSPVPPEHVSELVGLIDRGVISGKIAKSVFALMCDERKPPSEIVRERGLVQISDESELEKVVEKVIGEHPGPAEDFASGKEKALGFLVGRVMKETRGQANPRLVNEIIRRRLSG